MIDYGTLIKEGIIQAEKDVILYKNDEMEWFKVYQQRGSVDWNSVGPFYVLLMYPFEQYEQRIYIITTPEGYNIELVCKNKRKCNNIKIPLGLEEEEYFQRSIIEDMSLISWEDANEIHNLFMHLMEVYRKYD